MIKVGRGPEPLALSAARPGALAKCRPNGPANRAALPDDYRKVARDLWTAQHYKCAYCESREQLKRNDVEHFRPASRYWWLAFTWENLLFSCRNCNQAPYKLDKFPLLPGSVALVAEAAPPGNERPLLIDPASESGLEHLEFVSTRRPEGSRGWVPRARNGSVRGVETIATLGLDRADLLDLYKAHVDEDVQPNIDALRAVITGGQQVAIDAEWSRFCRAHLRPSAKYAALTLGVLDEEIPIAERAKWSLEVPAL